MQHHPLSNHPMPGRDPLASRQLSETGRRVAIADLLRPDEQRKKSDKTEQSAGQIARKWTANGKRGRVLERVRPTFLAGSPGSGTPARLNELDCVLFSDIGLVLVEVKRYAGRVQRPGPDGDIVVTKNDGSSARRRNPVAQLNDTRNRLREKLARDASWARYVEAWRYTRPGGTGSVPIYPVVVFGPSTENHEVLKVPGVEVTTTRGLKRVLDRLEDEGEHLVGSGQLAYQSARVWEQEGKLTSKGRKGLCTAVLLPETVRVNHKGVARSVTLAGVVKAECAGKGKVKLTWRDSKGTATVRVDHLPFAYYPQPNQEQLVRVDTRDGFVWTAESAA